MTKFTKISTLLTVFLFILVRTKPIWARFLPAGGNTLLLLLGLLIAFTLCILVVVSIYQLVFKRKFNRYYSYLPIFLTTICFADIRYNPLKVNLDNLFGKIIYESCRKGTQSRATFVLRGENSFEIHSTGVFFHEEYLRGKYEQKNDTLELEYEGIGLNNNFGNVAIIKQGNGITILNRESKIINQYVSLVQKKR